jgi:hypothetical protein
MYVKHQEKTQSLQAEELRELPSTPNAAVRRLSRERVIASS